MNTQVLPLGDRLNAGDKAKMKHGQEIVIGQVQPLQAGKRRQVLTAVGEMQRSVWLLECNLKQADQLALLESLQCSADKIDLLLK